MTKVNKTLRVRALTYFATEFQMIIIVLSFIYLLYTVAKSLKLKVQGGIGHSC